MANLSNTDDDSGLADENSEYKLPVTREQGGTLDDLSRPNGYGKSPDDQPARPSQERVVIPPNFPRKRK